jgi:hypothetical protein
LTVVILTPLLHSIENILLVLDADLSGLLLPALPQGT